MEANDNERLKEMFQQAIERVLDRRLSDALTGEKEWPLLDDYIDLRIEAFLSERHNE